MLNVVVVVVVLVPAVRAVAVWYTPPAETAVLIATTAPAALAAAPAEYCLWVRVVCVAQIQGPC